MKWKQAQWVFLNDRSNKRIQVYEVAYNKTVFYNL